jgi:hypothetical protein
MRGRIFGFIGAMLLLRAFGYFHDNAVQWQFSSTASGNYTAEFPGETTTETIDIPNSEMSMQMTSLDLGNMYFVLADLDIPAGAPVSLDDGVNAAIQAMRLDRTANWGSVEVDESPRATGDFEGNETREFSVVIKGDGHTARIKGLLFHQDGHLVQAVVLAMGILDMEQATRFLSSLRSTGTFLDA